MCVHKYKIRLSSIISVDFFSFQKNKQIKQIIIIIDEVNKNKCYLFINLSV
jgi:hypothetical protein